MMFVETMWEACGDFDLPFSTKAAPLFLQVDWYQRRPSGELELSLLPSCKDSTLWSCQFRLPGEQSCVSVHSPYRVVPQKHSRRSHFH